MYPALAVVERLIAEAGWSIDDVLWLGAAGVERELVQRAGLPYRAISAGGLHGVGLLAGVKNTVRLIVGTFQAMRLARQQRPGAMLTTGGFVAVPVAIACRWWRIPIVLLLPDVEPGQAVKFTARLATRIAVTTEASRAYFPADKVLVTGYPVRASLLNVDRAAALRHFELSPDRKTLLVFGGSKGARSLNRALGQIADRVLAKYQLLHISGSLDQAEAQQRRDQLPDELKQHYRLMAYVHDMGLALAAADLVVSRAGASILGEYPLFGLPSILVPYPHAWRYQRVNAQALAASGAAVVLDDATLSDTLLPAIEELLSDDGRRAQMQAAARALARPDAARVLAAEVARLAGIT